MEFQPDINYMRGQHVTLPGGQDKDGHPIILITIPQDSPLLDTEPSLNYILSIFRYAFITTSSASKVKRIFVNKLSSHFLQPVMRKVIISHCLQFHFSQKVNKSRFHLPGLYIFNKPTNQFSLESRMTPTK